MAFMVPEYWYGKMWVVDACEASPFPTDVISKQQAADECGVFEGEVEEVTGWWVRLSAPGYSDATDWSGPYESKREARKFVLDYYEVHPDTGDEMDWDYVDAQVVERLLGDEDGVKLMRLRSWS